MADKQLMELLEEVKEIALAAGRKIRAKKPGMISVEYKADGSPVTCADLAAHDIIVSALAGIGPSVHIISEESAEKLLPGKHSGKDVFWLVDPVDGTSGFIKGNGEYTVNIALVQDAVPVLGVIYAPAFEKLYYAASGAGAWRDSGEKPAVRLAGGKTDQPLTAVITNISPSARMRTFIAEHNIARVIHCSSSLKICLVAEGTADIYPRFGQTAQWDTAAGAVIAREAGCRVVDLERNDLRYDCSREIMHNGFLVYSPAAFPFQDKQANS